MKKVIKVSIPEPCHEDWAKMTTTEKGAFCKVCTKEVVDFTNKIDEDIVKYVLKNDNACGRFSKSQLDRDLKLERSAGQKLAPLAASLLLPLTMMASSLNVPKKTIVDNSTYTSLGLGSMHRSVDRIQITVNGTITDSEGNPLNNVMITVKETGKNTFTDNKGNYSITFLDKETLVFTHDNFESTQHTFGNFNEIYDAVLLPKIKQHILGKIAAPEHITKKDTVKSDVNLITIVGTVNDSQGLPLPGANVIVKGTKNGTQTDFDGNYNINARLGSVLNFSYVGFETQEKNVSFNSGTINVNMAEGGFLGGVIVVGYAVSDKNESFHPYGDFGETNYDPEREAARKARNKAAANGLAFKKLKMARLKAARKQKRASRKKK